MTFKRRACYDTARFFFMSIKIDKISENDIAAVVSLMREFAEYENLSQYCTVTAERLSSAMFGADAFVEGLIAFDDSEAVAYAVWYQGFSSFRGERSLYLEDIYIRDEYRRQRLGEKMLREIARIASRRGCERIDFLVLGRNTPAINFYKKLGAVSNEDERHFKISANAFKNLAA